MDSELHSKFYHATFIQRHIEISDGSSSSDSMMLLVTLKQQLTHTQASRVDTSVGRETERTTLQV